jgi:hypothetical protein
MTTIWGPPSWDVLHFAAHHYNPQKKEAIKCLFRAYSEGALACGSCTTHVAKYLTDNPIDEHLDTREALVIYVNRMHNTVNKRLGKRDVTLKESYEIFAPPYAGYLRKNSEKNLIIFSSGVALGSLLVYGILTLRQPKE